MSSPQAGCLRLADFIDGNLEAIVAEWENFARANWPGEVPGSAELRDNAMEMLMAVAADMRAFETARRERHGWSEGAGKAAINDLIRYALSLPVSTAVMGTPKAEFIDQNVAAAAAFKPMKTGEMDKLRARSRRNARVSNVSSTITAIRAGHKADARHQYASIARVWLWFVCWLIVIRRKFSL